MRAESSSDDDDVPLTGRVAGAKPEGGPEGGSEAAKRPLPPKPAPKPAPAPSVGSAASSSSSAPPKKAGAAASKPPAGPPKPKKPDAPPPKKLKNGYELFRQETSASVPAPPADELPDLGAIDEKRMRGLLKLLHEDVPESATRGELVYTAGQLLGRVGAPKWRRAERELTLRDRWKAMDKAERDKYEARVTALAEGDGGGSSEDDRPLVAKKKKSPPKPAPKKGAPASKKQKGPGGAAAGGGDDNIETIEVTCPELGDGWIRRSRKRKDGPKHVDHYYIAPDGTSFNSRVKVLRYLGLTEDPGATQGRQLTEEERAKREMKKLEARMARESEINERQSKKAKAREKQHAAREKQHAARERLQAALRTAAENAPARRRGFGDPEEDEAPPSCECPEPPGHLHLDEPALASEVLCTWAFACSCQQALHLSPVLPDDMAAAMTRPGASVILAELHTRLLRRILADAHVLRARQLPPPLDLGMLLQQVPPPSCVTAVNWPEVLRCVGWLVPDLHESEVQRSALRALHTTRYEDLALEQKLVLLRSIGDLFLSSEQMREVLSGNVEQHKEVLRARREQESSLRKELNSNPPVPAHIRELVAPPKPMADGGPSTALPPAWSDVDEEEEAGAGAGGGPSADGGAAEADAEAGAEGAALSPRAEKRRAAAARAAATEALLTAIASRDVDALYDAIDVAADSGGLEGKTEDGRLWVTEELKAARKQLHDLLMDQERAKRDEKVLRSQARCVRKHYDKLAKLPLREEPIGSDARGRRYWAFAYDPLRLWVELPETDGVCWAFYDTVASVQAVIDSLDGRDATAEGPLKKKLRENLPSLTREMAHDTVTNTDEGWLTEGHAYVGRRVLRIFPDAGASYGRITRWLPADEESDEGALFHVVHEADGDEEDLDEHEADQAVGAYDEQDRAGSGEVLPKVELHQPKYENRAERKALRIVPSSLGMSGARNELLDLEEAIHPVMRRAGSSWDSAEGIRSIWVLSVRNATTVVELAQLLIQLEQAIAVLQTSAPDVHERKPWRHEGSEHIGKRARRFFAGYGASDGTIDGWLPSDGDDPPLWHMVHGDDADEEDLDEAEVNFALENFALDRGESTAEEAAYLAQFAQANEGADGGADASEGAANISASSGASVPMGGFSLGSGGVCKKRLWSSHDCRERWQAALASPHSAAMISLATSSLRQHCYAFGLQDNKSKLKADDAKFQIGAWTHADAFGVGGGAGRGAAGVKKRKK